MAEGDALLQQLHFEVHPGRCLSVALFSDVQNAKWVPRLLASSQLAAPQPAQRALARFRCRGIREKIIAGGITPDYAFINAWVPRWEAGLPIEAAPSAEPGSGQGQREPRTPLLACAPQVADMYTLQVAAHRVLVAERLGRLQTRSLHAELIFYISGSRHVGGGAPGAVCWAFVLHGARLRGGGGGCRGCTAPQQRGHRWGRSRQPACCRVRR